jgi:hypothetical protein
MLKILQPEVGKLIEFERLKILKVLEMIETRSRTLRVWFLGIHDQRELGLLDDMTNEYWIFLEI